MFRYRKKAWGLCKKAGVWLTAGFVDRASRRLSGNKSSFAKHVAARMDECEPWEDHIEPTALKEIMSALKDKEFEIQEVLDRVRLSPQKMRKLRKSILITFEDAKNLKVIEPQFTLLMKTNESKEVEKLTSNLLVKAKSVFYTEIP